MELVCGFKEFGSGESPGILGNNLATLGGALQCSRSQLGLKPMWVGVEGTVVPNS